MTEGYKPIFDKAEEASVDMDYRSLFPAFHEYPDLFHFIMAPSHQHWPDYGALELAQNVDQSIHDSLVAKGPSLVGHGSQTLDEIESRHVLLMTYLIHNLGKDWGNVVEIGGGYGNCLRLVSNIVDYTLWSIIDMQYILELQDWFLEETSTDTTHVQFINPYNLKAQRALYPNLVMGIHSLSEFSLDDFTGYFNLVIKKAKWFFYVSHRNNPNRELLDAKLELIKTQFYTHATMNYEGESSIMYLFGRTT